MSDHDALPPAQQVNRPFGMADALQGGQHRAMARVGLIGFGAIGSEMAELWPQELEGCAELTAILVRQAQVDAVSARAPRPTRVFGDLAGFLSCELDVVVEAAGHAAVAEYALRVLDSGCELHLLSSGALAAESLRRRLIATAHRSGGRIIIPAGALAGFDGLSSLRAGGLVSVKYTCIKPVGAWRGTAAEASFRLSDIKGAQTIFSGTAREAAVAFPRNANLAASVALAGLGFERTLVELVADPEASQNTARIEAVSAVGTLDVSLVSSAFDDNPKTSRITAMSALAALRGRADPVSFG